MDEFSLKNAVISLNPMMLRDLTWEIKILINKQEYGIGFGMDFQKRGGNTVKINKIGSEEEFEKCRQEIPYYFEFLEANKRFFPEKAYYQFLGEFDEKSLRVIFPE